MAGEAGVVIAPVDRIVLEEEGSLFLLVAPQADIGHVPLGLSGCPASIPLVATGAGEPAFLDGVVGEVTELPLLAGMAIEAEVGLGLPEELRGGRSLVDVVTGEASDAGSTVVVAIPGGGGDGAGMALEAHFTLLFSG